MPVRQALALTVAALALLPAAAQARPAERPSDRLDDPYNQAAVSAMAASMAAMVLDMPVGRFADAMAAMGDPEAARVPPDARLGDLAGPEARDMPRRIARETPRMMGAMAGMSAAIEDMIPQFAAMADQMRGAVDRAQRDYDREDYDRRR